MQQNITNEAILDWLKRRGITENVLAIFNITTYKHPSIGPSIKIPYTETHAKYRRDPADERKPKYVNDVGGKVTLYAADKVDWNKPVLITEGELDTLVAWSKNIQAVSSTGGARTFRPEWAKYFTGKTYVCFDNDPTGAESMVKILSLIPDVYVVLIPDQPDVKDISDYVSRGGDLHSLLATAKQYPNIESIKEDMLERQATWRSTGFHKAYLDNAQKELRQSTYKTPTYEGDDRVLKAKTVPITRLLKFSQKKTVCPWHNENTPSLHFYEKTNSVYCFGCGKYADAIDVYREVHGCGFKKAIDDLNKMV